jgi:ABC-type iron transport system FetAB permease component
LREKPDSGVYVKDLSSFVIHTPDEMKDKLALGKSNRAVGETKMNRDSSRSHSIFMINVETIETSADGE